MRAAYNKEEEGGENDLVRSLETKFSLKEKLEVYDQLKKKRPNKKGPVMFIPEEFANSSSANNNSSSRNSQGERGGSSDSMQQKISKGRRYMNRQDFLYLNDGNNNQIERQSNAINDSDHLTIHQSRRTSSSSSSGGKDAVRRNKHNNNSNASDDAAMQSDELDFQKLMRQSAELRIAKEQQQQLSQRPPLGRPVTATATLSARGGGSSNRTEQHSDTSCANVITSKAKRESASAPSHSVPIITAGSTSAVPSRAPSASSYSSSNSQQLQRHQLHQSHRRDSNVSSRTKKDDEENNIGDDVVKRSCMIVPEGFVPRVATLQTKNIVEERLEEQEANKRRPSKSFDPDKLHSVQRYQEQQEEREKLLRNLALQDAKKRTFKARPLPKHHHHHHNNSVNHANSFADGELAEAERSYGGAKTGLTADLLARLAKDEEGAALLAQMEAADIDVETALATQLSARSDKSNHSHGNSKQSGSNGAASSIPAWTALGGQSSSRSKASDDDVDVTAAVGGGHRGDREANTKDSIDDNGDDSNNSGGGGGGGDRGDAEVGSTSGKRAVPQTDGGLLKLLGRKRPSLLMTSAGGGENSGGGNSTVASGSGGGGHSLRMGDLLDKGMLERQEEWEKARKLKMETALLMKRAEEEEEVQAVGEMPLTANESWVKAKAAHELTKLKQLKEEQDRAAQKEARKQIEERKHAALIEEARKALHDVSSGGGIGNKAKRGRRRPRASRPSPASSAGREGGGGGVGEDGRVGRKGRRGIDRAGAVFNTELEAGDSVIAAMDPLGVNLALSEDEFYRLAVQRIVERQAMQIEGGGGGAGGGGGGGGAKRTYRRASSLPASASPRRSSYGDDDIGSGHGIDRRRQQQQQQFGARRALPLSAVHPHPYSHAHPISSRVVGSAGLSQPPPSSWDSSAAITSGGGGGGGVTCRTHNNTISPYAIPQTLPGQTGAAALVGGAPTTAAAAKFAKFQHQLLGHNNKASAVEVREGRWRNRNAKKRSLSASAAGSPRRDMASGVRAHGKHLRGSWILDGRGGPNDLLYGDYSTINDHDDDGGDVVSDDDDDDDDDGSNDDGEDINDTLLVGVSGSDSHDRDMYSDAVAVMARYGYSSPPGKGCSGPLVVSNAGREEHGGGGARRSHVMSVLDSNSWGGKGIVPGISPQQQWPRDNNEDFKRQSHCQLQGEEGGSSGTPNVIPAVGGHPSSRSLNPGRTPSSMTATTANTAASITTSSPFRSLPSHNYNYSSPNPQLQLQHQLQHHQPGGALGLAGSIVTSQHEKIMTSSSSVSLSPGPQDINSNINNSISSNHLPSYSRQVLFGGSSSRADHMLGVNGDSADKGGGGGGGSSGGVIDRSNVFISGSNGGYSTDLGSSSGGGINAGDVRHHKQQQHNQLAPHKRWEKEGGRFFDVATSSADKGRFRVRDARHFLPDTMYRKDDEASGGGGDRRSGNKGVSLLLGQRAEPPHEEQVVTIMFDRGVFDEEEAARWWLANRQRFVVS